MGKFDGVLIVTDLDGTLLRNDKSVSAENLAAIRRFQAEGGLFSFVTGRIPRGAKSVVDTVRPNAPCGHGNGGSIYDHRTEEHVWSVNVSPVVARLVDDTAARFPHAGVILCTKDDAYFQHKNASSDAFCRNEHFAGHVGKIHTMTEPLTKVMFTLTETEGLFELMEYVSAHPLADEFALIRTDEAYFEVLPKGASKGTQIARLSEITGVPVERIIAVGDNDNDVSMLKAAGVGVAVANASEAAKAAADCITVSNEEHAIAHIIKELETGKRVV